MPNTAESDLSFPRGVPNGKRGNDAAPFPLRSITINAPPDKVFAYIANPMNQPEWMPSMIEVKDVTGEGVGATHKWVYKLAGLRFEGEDTCTEYAPNEKIVTRTKGGISSTWAYTFVPEGEGTRLNLEIEYTIPVPVLGRVAERLALSQNEREADPGMANIKARLEG